MVHRGPSKKKNQRNHNQKVTERDGTHQQQQQQLATAPTNHEPRKETSKDTPKRHQSGCWWTIRIGFNLNLQSLLSVLIFFLIFFFFFLSISAGGHRWPVRLFVSPCVFSLSTAAFGGIRRHSAAFGGGGGGGGRWEAYRRLIYGHSGRRQRNAPLFSFPLFFLFHFYYYFFVLFF